MKCLFHPSEFGKINRICIRITGGQQFRRTRRDDFDNDRSSMRGGRQMQQRDSSMGRSDHHGTQPAVGRNMNTGNGNY